MELNMATNQQDTLISKTWIWLTLWLAFFASYFFRSNGLESQAISVSKHPISNMPEDIVPQNTYATTAIDLQTNITLEELESKKPSYTSEHRALLSFINDMELQVVNNLSQYVLDLYNNGLFSMKIFDESLNRIDILKDSNKDTSALEELKQKIILLKIHDSLNQIQTLNVIKTDSESLLLQELAQLEKELQEITDGDLEDYEALSDFDLDDISLSDEDYEMFNTYNQENIVLQNSKFTFDTFKYDILLDRIQTQLHLINSAEKLLTKFDDDVFSILDKLINLLDINNDRVLETVEQLEKIKPYNTTPGLHL